MQNIYTQLIFSDPEMYLKLTYAFLIVKWRIYSPCTHDPQS